MVYNGMNTDSLIAFSSTIQQNVDKVQNVSAAAVTGAQKQVWELFGVGDKYSQQTNLTDTSLQSSQQADTAVTSYGDANPSARTTISSMRADGRTPQEIEAWINSAK
jgi:hypothetical protein